MFLAVAEVVEYRSLRSTSSAGKFNVDYGKWNIHLRMHYISNAMSIMHLQLPTNLPNATTDICVFASDLWTKQLRAQTGQVYQG